MEMAKVVSSHSTTSGHILDLTRLTMASQATGRLSSVGHPSAFPPGPLVIDVSIKGALTHSLPMPLPALLALLGPSLRNI